MQILWSSSQSSDVFCHILLHFATSNVCEVGRYVSPGQWPGGRPAEGPEQNQRERERELKDLAERRPERVEEQVTQV